MNINQLVRNAKQAVPSLKGLPDEDARQLLQRAFEGIVEEIEATREGSVRIPALGNFAIRRVQREKEGRKVEEQRIVFRPSKAA